MEINNKSKQDIYETNFLEIAAFYNKFEYLFLAHYEKTGINLWFLNHFKTYMTYRNNNLINLSSGINRSKNKSKITSKLFRFIKETFFILRQYTTPHKLDSDFLLISNQSHLRNGINPSYKGFDFPELYNRPLYFMRQGINDEKLNYKKQLTSDDLLVNAFTSPNLYFKTISFIVETKLLKRKISKQCSSPIDIKINQIFWAHFPFFILSYLRFLSFDKFFNNQNTLKGIFLMDENSPQQKIIQYASQKNNIKVFAFQHGNIQKMHPAYIFGAYQTPPILPDITFTWGSYFNDLLVNKGGYQPNALYAAGRLNSANNAVKQKHTLPHQKRTILYASQPHGDSDFRKQLIVDLFTSCKESKYQYHVILRPHPIETNDEYFHEIANEVNFTAYTLDRKSPLEQHFQKADILVVAFSTLGTEFVPYYKPILVTDYFNLDLINWIKEGVGIAVRDKKMLLSYLNKENIEIDLEKYEAFIKKYYITGKQVENNVLSKIKLLFQ